MAEWVSVPKTAPRNSGCTVVAAASYSGADQRGGRSQHRLRSCQNRDLATSSCGADSAGLDLQHKQSRVHGGPRGYARRGCHVCLGPGSSQYMTAKRGDRAEPCAHLVCGKRTPMFPLGLIPWCRLDASSDKSQDCASALTHAKRYNEGNCNEWIKHRVMQRSSTPSMLVAKLPLACGCALSMYLNAFQLFESVAVSSCSALAHHRHKYCPQSSRVRSPTVAAEICTRSFSLEPGVLGCS